ncbi:hypothetical protein [Brevundimonas sp.]|uniref:hypothetical protein n=2 Tax=Brevundimonas sp. TaxID=1871086 RepID=UPI002FCC4852
MSSIVLPSPAQQTRRYAVLAAAIFAIAIPILQALGSIGQSQAEFAADGNTTLRVAGYAFSIWGLLYAGLLAYAVRQALPQTGESTLINALGWPSFVTLIGIGLWIITAALDMKSASVIVIFASLLAILLPMLMLGRTIRTTSLLDRDRMLVIWPLAALAGWLTVAAPLNLITVLTAYDALPAMLSPTVWAIVFVAITTLVAIAVSWVLRTLAYPIPIAWGFVGAFVAHQDNNPVLSFAALGAAFVVIVFGSIFTFGLRRTK